MKIFNSVDLNDNDYSIMVTLEKISSKSIYYLKDLNAKSKPIPWFHTRMNKIIGLSLNLHSNSEFSDIIFQLHNLEVLTIKCNNEKKIPDRFDNLPNLKSLTLSWCFLRDLPSSIGKLTHLEFLDISENHNFKRLPSFLNNLPNLTDIDVSGNYIRTLSGLSSKIVLATISSIDYETQEFDHCGLTQTAEDLIIEICQKENWENSKEFQQLLDYYKKTPMELAEQFVKGDPLTSEELIRLEHEAGASELEFIRKKLSKTDKMVQTIEKRLNAFQ